MSGIRVVVEVSSADRPESLGGSRVTVFADNYDDALKALLLYRAGKILSTQILKTGIDVRKGGKNASVLTDGQ